MQSFLCCVTSATHPLVSRHSTLLPESTKTGHASLVSPGPPPPQTDMMPYDFTYQGDQDLQELS